jgi:ABC-type bacteriocin/lantibiotic exporter with double-glycine peptidase domain
MAFNVEGEMPVLAKYPVAKQQTANSCWACAARSIANFAGSAYASDQKLADAYAAKTKKPANGDINKMQSAADALARLGFPSKADSEPFPTPKEILDEINKKTPILAIVGDTNPKGKRNLKYQEGHWVVIVGISDDGKTIDVFDPADGALHQVAYDAATYGKGVYWQNASYF